MAVFVLVHGAWGGAHGFRKVRGPLWAAGHEVFTPSLTGIGERAHLTSAGRRLGHREETHHGGVTELRETNGSHFGHNETPEIVETGGTPMRLSQISSSSSTPRSRRCGWRRGGRWS